MTNTGAPGLAFSLVCFSCKVQFRSPRYKEGALAAVLSAGCGPGFKQGCRRLKGRDCCGPCCGAGPALPSTARVGGSSRGGSGSGSSGWHWAGCLNGGQICFQVVSAQGNKLKSLFASPC